MSPKPILIVLFYSFYLGLIMVTCLEKKKKKEREVLISSEKA